MATNNRTADVLLRWQVDTASVNRVRASFTNLESELDDLRAELTGVGTAAQQGVNGLRQRFAQGEASVESMQDEAEQLRRELLALDDVKVTPVVDVQQADGGSIRGNSTLNTVDRFGRFGTQISGAFGQAGGLGNVVGLVGDVADSFGTLGVAGGAAALAIGGLSIALNELKRIADEAKAAEAARLAGEIAGEQLAGSSPSQLKDRLTELIDQIRRNEESLAERRQEISNLQLEYQNADIVRAQEYYGRVAAINEEITRLQNANATAAGEFVEVSAQYNAAINGVKAGITSLTKGLNDLNLSLTNISKSGTFTGGIASGGAVNTKDAKAAQEAAAAALLSDRTDAYLASITKTTQAQELLTKAQEAYNAEVAASGARIAEINAKLQADLSQAETQRQSDLADAARQAGEERVRITEDAEQERARIQRRFERSYNDAVADRDALAAKRAEDQRDDELKDLDDRYKDQLKTVDKSLATQQRTIEARYQQQVATINAAAQAAIRSEQQAAQARLAVLQQGVQAAQVALINAQQSEFLIRQNFYNQAVSQAQVWANLMKLYTSYGFSAPTAPTLPSPKQPIIIGGKASGGPVTANTPYMVGEKGPELFVPAQSGRIVPNGAALTINVVGAQSDTIRAESRQQALAAFDRVIRQMGVA